MNTDLLDNQQPAPQMPSVAGPQTPSPGRSGGRQGLQFSRGNLVLVALLVGGLAVVYVMSLNEGPAEASAEQRAAQQQVETALTAFKTSGASADAQRMKAAAVVKEFYHDTRQRQVPLDALQKNPCEFIPPPGNEPAVVRQEQAAPPPPAEPTEQEKAEERMLQAASRLQLQSIMVGSRGATAMISNNILAEGRQIEGWTVWKIEANEVLLAWKDKTHTLRLPQ